MFKKMFRRLTQSREERYLQDLEAFAKSISKSPHAAGVARRLGFLKYDIDQRIASSDRSMLEIEDFAEVSESVCDGVIEKLKEIAALELELPDIISSSDGRRFESHMKRWRTANATVMRAYAMLRHAATGEKPASLDALMRDGESLNGALDSLELQIRTAERIRNELGG